MQRNYNFIYKELVEHEYDIVGHIAYSLYKADKIKFIEAFKQKNNGKEPEDADLIPFHDTSCLEGYVERYKLTASFILEQFLNNSLDESKKEMEQKCLEDHKKMLAEVIVPLTPITEERRKQLLKEAVVDKLALISKSEHETMLKEKVVDPLSPKSQTHQFWFGVSQSIAGAFIFAIFLAFIGFIALFKTNDINLSITTPQGTTKALKITPVDTIPENTASTNIQKPTP